MAEVVGREGVWEEGVEAGAARCGWRRRRDARASRCCRDRRGGAGDRRRHGRREERSELPLDLDRELRLRDVLLRELEHTWQFLAHVLRCAACVRRHRRRDRADACLRRRGPRDPPPALLRLDRLALPTCPLDRLGFDYARGEKRRRDVPPGRRLACCWRGRAGRRMRRRSRDWPSRAWTGILPVEQELERRRAPLGLG